MKRPAFVFQYQALRNPKREHPVTALRFVLLPSYFSSSRVDPDGLGRFLRANDLPKRSLRFLFSFPCSDLAAHTFPIGPLILCSLIYNVGGVSLPVPLIPPDL